MWRAGARAVRLGLGLLLAGSALAAEPVVLPAGERASDWSTALSLAGLEPGDVTAAGTVVRVDVADATWVLRAVRPDGAVREARIPAPTTAADREEVAFLARALLRELAVGSARAPTSSLVVLPPPPEPMPMPVPVPAPAPEPAAEPAPAPEPEPAPAPEPAPEPAPPPAPAPAPAPEPAPAPPPPPRGVPARVGAAASLRPGLPVALATVVGIDLGTVRSWTLTTELAWVSPRRLDLDFSPRMMAFEGTAWARAGAGGRLSAGPVVGASYRSYRQQDTSVAWGVQPVLGLQAEVSVLQLGPVGFAVDLQALADLGETRLHAADGEVSTLPPIDLRLGLRGFSAPRRDPFPRDRTSP